MNAQVPGPPTVTSSPILKVISPASTQATSSLSWWRWNRLLVPAGTVSSNSMMLSFVSWPRSFKAAKRPGGPMSRCCPAPAGMTRPLAMFMRVSSQLPLRRLVQPLEEAPAVALEVERLVDAILPRMVVRPAVDPCTGGARALVMRVDVVDVHADVLARAPGGLRADRAVGALAADPDHAVAHLDVGVEDPALRAHHPRGRDL